MGRAGRSRSHHILILVRGVEKWVCHSRIARPRLDHPVMQRGQQNMTSVQRGFGAGGFSWVTPDIARAYNLRRTCQDAPSEIVGGGGETAP